jgi:hypothetical protein
MQMVRSLCQPEGGWPQDLPQTPETLVAYVSEEVEELVESLHPVSPLDDAPLQGNELGGGGIIPTLHRDRSVASLIDTLLWEIAASTYEAMRLLEGVKATVDFPDPLTDQTRLVRLVPVLSFYPTGGSPLHLDLVTQTAAVLDEGLPLTCSLALTDGDLFAQPQSVQDWLAALRQESERFMPGVRSLYTGWDVTVLMPGLPWQSGRLVLDLMLLDAGAIAAPERIPADSTLNFTPVLPDLPQEMDLFRLGGDRLPNAVPPLPSAPSPKLLPPAPLPPALDSQVTFLETIWVEAVIASELARGLLATAPWELGETALKDPQDWVTRAFQTLDRGAGDRLFSVAFVQPQPRLQDVWLRLRWLALRSYAPLSKLMGRVPSALLLPHAPWVYGDLSLQVGLGLQTPQEDWLLDLSRGEWTAPPPVLPATGVVALTDSSLGGSQIWQVGELRSHLHHTLCTASPTVQHLLTGTALALHDTDPSAPFHPVQMQLHIALVFHPQ